MSRPGGWLDLVEGSLVGVDSAAIIYAIERHPRYVEAMEAFLTFLAESRVQAVTSTVTLVEVLTRPLRLGDDMLVAEYGAFLGDTRGLAVRDLSPLIAREAARLRADYNLRTPDAVQLGTAIIEGAGFFLTNDTQLQRVAELRVLVLSQLA